MEEVHIVDSPLGHIRITYNNKGITGVKFTKDPDKTSSVNNPNNENLQLVVRWFEAYFKDPNETKSMQFPTLDMEAHNGKAFMCKVWNVLKDRIGPGQTISYGELAKLCGSPKAARAVGQAMKTNPFTIFVPCHRVINASGEMGNYSGGVDKKQWLLKHEGKDFSTATKSTKFMSLF
jgi:methylated-DNA-[protein]-cysteine S-methyltransferase